MAATKPHAPTDWLLKLLDPFTSWCLHVEAEERSPRWAAWFTERYVRWYLMKTFAPAIHQANAQGIGYVDAWMPPGTPAEAVTAWFEAQIMGSQPTRIGAVDYILCYVFHCSPDDQATVAWNNVPPPEREIGQWHGPMREWWREGAAVIAGLVPQDHGGLYLLVNRVGDAVQSLTAYRG